LNQKLILSAESNYTNSIKKYTWLPVGTSTCDPCRSVSVAPSQNQWFAVKTDLNGCFASDSINIKVLNEKLVFIPNAFSPNGDQINDLFRPFTAEAVEEIEYFIVYDCWGNHIYGTSSFKPNDNKTGWDGTYKGIAANDGVYTYATQVRLRNGKTQRYVGDVMLVR
jgi:gliding motility-associated-like protein